MDTLETPPGKNPLLSQNFKKRASILSVCVLTSAGLFTSPSMAFAAEIGYPVAPTANDFCGTADDTANLQAAAGVTWYQVVDGARVEVSAGVIPAGGLTADFVAVATSPEDTFPGGETELNYTLTYTDEACDILVNPNHPRFDDFAGTANDTVTIPATEGVIYFMNGIAVQAGVYGGAGEVVVEAVAEEGYQIDPAFQSVFTYTFDAQDLVAVSAIPPEFNDVSGTAEDTVTIPTTEGVQYFINSVAVTAGVYPGEGEVIVEAVATEGYTLEPSSDAIFVHSFDATVYATVVAPAPPTFIDESGTANDTVVIPETEGVTYLLNGGTAGAGTYPSTGAVTVEAVANEGFTLDPDSQSVFNYTFDAAVDAVIVSPLAPTIQENCGIENDGIIIEAQEGVDYYLVGVDADQLLTLGLNEGITGDVTVNAVAQEGYELAADAQVTWNFSIMDDECIVATPAAPEFVDESGTAEDLVVIPETEGVNYTLNGEAVVAGEYPGVGEVVVEATAANGYNISPDAQTTWDFVFDADVVVTPEEPVFTDVSGVENDTVTIPEVEGVSYLLNGEEVVAGEYPALGTVTVEAVAEEGFEFAPDATTEWTETFDVEVIVEPAAPVFVDASGTDNDTVTIPDAEGVQYLLNGEEVVAGEYPGVGDVNVTAVPEEGYAFDAEATTEWNFAFGDEIIVTPAAPVFTDRPGTADDIVTIPDAEGVDYLLNGEPAAPGEHAVTGNVTVEAVAEEGYALDPDATTTFNFAFSDAPDTRVTPRAPEFNDVAGTENDTVTIPDAEGVQYLLNGEEVAPGTYPGVGTVTVEAIPEEGVEFAADADTNWTFEFEGDVVVTPQRPTVDGNVLTIPDTQGVQYFLNGEAVGPGTYTLTGASVVTAEALPGYELAEGAAFTWEVEPEVAPIDETPVDETPVTTPVTPPAVTPILTPGVITPAANDGFVVADDFTTDDGFRNDNLADTGASPALFGLLGAGGLLTALGAGLTRFGRNKKA